jgi:hypothetical protein
LLRADIEVLQRHAADYLAHLREVGGQVTRVVDKLPGNFAHLGLIATLFPKAHVIHCRRDPVDTCLSCYFQNFQSLIFSNSLEHLGFYYQEYERLMAHWRQALPIGMYEVQYEELVNNQERISRDMIAYCGLDWDERCLAPHENTRAVQTASEFQVRRPVYKTSVARWKRYEKHLGPLLEALGEYAPSSAVTAS